MRNTKPGIPGVLAAVCCLLSAAFVSTSASPAVSLPEQSLANLRRLRSFRYSLVMSRSEPPAVSGSFTGTVFLPDTQEQVGSWNQTPRMRVKARGDAEYIRYESATPGFDTSWSVHDRSKEGAFLTQVEHVLAFDSFRLVRQDSRRAEYSFTPNLPFLDPLLTKQLSGIFRVVRDRVLPEEIIVTSSDKVVSWQAKFSDYDGAPAISFPFVPRWRVVLTPDSMPRGRDSQPAIGYGSDTVLLRERLAALGFASRFRRCGDSLELIMEREVRDDLLQFMTRPGRTEVWVGRYFLGQGPVPESGRKVIMAGGDRAAMILERRVFDARGIAGLSVDDSLGIRRLTLTITRDAQVRLGGLSRLEKSGLLLVLAVDDAALAVLEIARPSARLEFELSTPLGTQFPQALAAIMRSGTLAGQYRIASRQELRR